MYQEMALVAALLTVAPMKTLFPLVAVLFVQTKTRLFVRYVETELVWPLVGRFVIEVYSVTI
jgi:hypothetical protein